MSIKREPPDIANRLQKNLDLSANDFSSLDIDGIEHLISPGNYRNLNKFNKIFVCSEIFYHFLGKDSISLSYEDFGSLDMMEALGGSIIDGSSGFSRWQHLSEFTCRYLL